MRALLALLLTLGFALPAFAQPSPLVARLSSNRVFITTAFTGESLMVFGSTEEPLGPGGDEVVVVARGPSSPFVVRRKVQVLGLWLNGPSARFEDVPTFYAVAGTRPAWRILPEEVRRNLGLGLDALPLDRRSGARSPGFRAALLALKQEAGLWQEDRSTVEVAGSRLFNLLLPLPATVQPGSYRVEVLLVRSRRVVARENLGFTVERVGTAASINEVARERPALYAIVCILLAGLTGWLGSVLFRRS
ncbi:TIGR02186 family protein [Sabulicella rubraurantiaca]|uniref:TIGR02186 family protein n=1 Tax=Sabulicella rubraurantiaca TaxID=2811429 RepID=UPI001A96E757|nr:TIGR02186 family protein [Sabulicella rubraurantiaca]